MNADEIKSKAAETMSNVKKKVEAIASDKRVQNVKLSLLRFISDVKVWIVSNINSRKRNTMKCNTYIDPKTGIALEGEALKNASRTAGAVCCGYELEPDDIFCPSCGARVVEATTDWWMFSGRATRKEYWKKMVLINIGFLVCLGIFVVCGGDLDDSEDFIISVVMGFISNIVLLPVSVRRLHDLGDSGWLLTVSPCLSIVGFVLTSIPIEWFQLWCSLFLFLASCSFGLVLFALMGFKRGTRGPNKYGPDPLAGK